MEFLLEKGKHIQIVMNKFEEHHSHDLPNRNHTFTSTFM